MFWAWLLIFSISGWFGSVVGSNFLGIILSIKPLLKSNIVLLSVAIAPPPTCAPIATIDDWSGNIEDSNLYDLTVDFVLCSSSSNIFLYASILSLEST